MINFQTARKLYAVSKEDFGLWVIAFVATSVLGVTWGIAVSIAASVILLVKFQARPATRILGKLPNTSVYVDVKQFPQAVELDGIKIFSFEACLHFVNKDHFEAKIKKMESRAKTPIDAVIIDCASVNKIDFTCMKMLVRLATRYKAMNIKLLFANWTGMSTMDKIIEGMELYKEIDEGNFFLTIDGAVDCAVEGRDTKRENSEDTEDEEQGNGECEREMVNKVESDNRL